MTDVLSKVVLVGASGTIGSHILNALLHESNDDFKITILTRPGSTSTFPSHPSITVVRVAHDDLPTLTTTFHDHDAIIHVGGIPSITSQPLMIQAAVAAGVKRFILNEFANSPVTQKGLPETERFRTPRWNVREVAERAVSDAERNGKDFSWTGLAVGNIIDLSLIKYPQFGINIKERRVKFTDDGMENITGVTLPDIGIAVRGILKRPSETRNRYCHIRSVETNQVDIVKALEEQQECVYEKSAEGSDALYGRGREGFAKGERSAFHDLVVVQLFGRVEGKGSSVLIGREESDNELLGIREKDVGEIVRDVLLRLDEVESASQRGKDVLGEARRTMG